MTEATVIVAAWRAEATLERAVASALAQTSVSTEVIVIDDASPDGTFALAESLSARDGRVRALRLAQNSGPSAARNLGLAEARSRWIAVLDADDSYAPDRLARMIALADARQADAVFDDFQPVDAEGSATGATHLAPLGMTVPVRWDLESFLAGCQAEPGRPSLGYLKPLLCRDFLRTHHIGYDDALRNGEDFHLIAALLAAGGALWIAPEAGYRYTVAHGSISNRLDAGHARALARADAAFLERNAPGMTPEAVRLMRRRMRRLGDLGTAEMVLQSLRAGAPGRAAAALAGRPRAAGRVLLQGWEAARRRLS